MRVYRVEGEDGRGPYNGHTRTWFYDHDEVVQIMPKAMENGDPLRPTPHGAWDKFNKYDGKALFGFKSLQQLDTWFPAPVRTALAETDYKLAVYEVPKVAVWSDEHQAAFDRMAASRVGAVPLTIPLKAASIRAAIASNSVVRAGRP